MDVKISIIIATFNASLTLRKCLESIVVQLTEECELIIIDGGSKDNTIDIIAFYDKFISYSISESDKGIYDAWNKGVKSAQGDWIMFIGADDVLLPNALSIYLDVIRNTPDINDYDYICAHNEYVDLNGKVLKVLGEAPKWSKMRRLMPAAHVASLHNRKNLFETIGYYDFEKFHICADYELLLRKKDKLKYLMLPAHIARMKVGGMSFSTKAIKETYEIRKLHKSVSPLLNRLLYFSDLMAFKFFKFRMALGGASFS